MFSQSNRKWVISFGVFITLICAATLLVRSSRPMVAGQIRLERVPAEPLSTDRLTDVQIEAIVAEEVPLGSSTKDVRMWIEHRKMTIDNWRGDSLDTATYIEVILSSSNLGSTRLYFGLYRNGTLTESGIKVYISD